MLRIEIPKSKEKLLKQIIGLKKLIKLDTNDKDIKIHTRALIESENALKTMSK